MLDVSRLLYDADFCEAFVIRHRKGDWQDGAFIVNMEEKQVLGIVEPTSGEDLKQLPEADRVGALMTFYSKEPLSLGEEDQVSDEIISRGRIYQLLQVQDWSRHGFYKAIASLSGRDMDGTA